MGGIESLKLARFQWVASQAKCAANAICNRSWLAGIDYGFVAELTYI
jgi:hypothetical protein